MCLPSTSSRRCHSLPSYHASPSLFLPQRCLDFAIHLEIDFSLFFETDSFEICRKCACTISSGNPKNYGWTNNRCQRRTLANYISKILVVSLQVFSDFVFKDLNWILHVSIIKSHIFSTVNIHSIDFADSNQE